MAYEPLHRRAETGIPIVVTPGNHERSKMPPSLWLAHPNIHVFDRPRTFSFVTNSGVSLSIAGFPFARGDVRSNFNAILEETDWEEAQSEVKLLSMHQAVEGATVGPSDYTFRRGKDTIRLADIPQDFAAVLAGHIHRRQVLNRDRVPVVYPGSVERTSFAERDEPKGFVHVELAQSLEGRWAMSQARFHPLPTRPMVDVNIDAEIPFTGMREHLQGLVAGLDRDSIVRLRCTGEPDESFKAKLTAPFLRSVFPTSMSVQIGTELYVEPYRARGYARR
jgi:DNA repair exonuclease SbcCD nuclease subunit